jgi:ABC-type Fe3+/spermidine/putrescine transport system ATPase subunit
VLYNDFVVVGVGSTVSRGISEVEESDIFTASHPVLAASINKMNLSTTFQENAFVREMSVFKNANYG